MFKKTTILLNYLFLLPAIVIVARFPQWLDAFSTKADVASLGVTLVALTLSVLIRVRVQNWFEYYVETPLAEFNADIKRENVSWLQLVRVASSYAWATASRAMISFAFATGLIYWIVDYTKQKLAVLPPNHVEVWVLPSIATVGVVAWFMQFYADVVAVLDTQDIVEDILDNAEKTLDKPSDEQE